MPGGRHCARSCSFKPGDADLEELVEVAADDAQEAQPLEQRNVRVLRQREDAPVEREQRQLAVDRRAASAMVGERMAGAPRARRNRTAGRATVVTVVSISCDVPDGYDSSWAAPSPDRGASAASMRTRSSASHTQRPSTSRSSASR